MRNIEAESSGHGAKDKDSGLLSSVVDYLIENSVNPIDKANLINLINTIISTILTI